MLVAIGMLAVMVCLVPDVASGQTTSQPRNVWGPAPVASRVDQAKADALIRDMVEPTLTLDVDPRRSKILRTERPISRISVTDPTILEITEFSATEYELIGKKTGQTSLTFWYADDQGNSDVLRYVVRVSPDEGTEDRRKIEYGDLQDKVNELFPNSVVQLFPVADKLIVRGQARDAEEATQIMSVIRGDSQGAGNGGNGGWGGGWGRVVGGGSAADPYPGTSDLPGTTVINLMDVPGEQQVLLKVRVAELSRTALREMGAELSFDIGDVAFNSSLGLGGAVSAVLSTDDVELTLEALATNSYAKVLAEPNLVTLSGHPAYFIAGGEFAVPVVVGVEGASAATTNFRGFGTQVNFTPTVLDKDRIRLHVSPSFSSLNGGNSVDGIPGLDTRAVSTTVDLREGQWLAIAGLIQDQQSGSKVRVPFIGDIPVLDTFFSNREVRREETELLILVSPELVHPLEAEEAPLILPGMEVTEPKDVAFYLGGRYEGKADCDHRSTVWPVLQRQILDARTDAKRQPKYQDCESYYIQGDHGFSR